MDGLIGGPCETYREAAPRGLEPIRRDTVKTSMVAGIDVTGAQNCVMSKGTVGLERLADRFRGRIHDRRHADPLSITGCEAHLLISAQTADPVIWS